MKLDGKFLNKIVDIIIEKANSWITPQNKLDDIHIDELHDAFKDKSVWINSSIEIFEHLKKRLKDSRYDAILAIPLSISYSKMNIPNDIHEDILSHTPPSFYLFEKVNHFEREFIENSRLIDPFNLITSNKIYFNETSEIEWSNNKEEEVFYRNVFIV